jgi:hypothetical protein
MGQHWLLSDDEQFQYTGKDWLLLLLDCYSKEQRDLILLLLESVICPQHHHTWHRPYAHDGIVCAKLSRKFDQEQGTHLMRK